MNIEFKNALAARLIAAQDALTDEITTLSTSDRTDEANQKKAARNIYGICIELLRTFDDAQAYERQLDHLRQAWQRSREIAGAHNDFERVAMEDKKLAALANAWALYETTKQEAAL